jgi:hypothetical protein
MMLGRKTLEEKITATVREEFAGIIAGLERDHQEYRRRLRLKEKTRRALEDAESEVRRLYAERTALKKRFWEAYYKKDEAALSEIEYQSRIVDRATTKAEKTLERAHADFGKADFDEVEEGFALKAKANIAEDEVNRRLRTLEETLEDLLAGVRHDVKEAGQALREEYKEPHFDTAEEQDAHVKRMVEVLNTVAETYVPGK